TIAMAKLGSNPNSATSQWFFNLANNSQNLNSQNGGFTVFGRVANADSLAIMDKIAAVPVPNPPLFDSPFDAMPLINYRGGPLREENLVLVTSIEVLDTPAASVIEASGIVTATSFGGFAAAAPGSFIEIYGSNLAGESRSWSEADFTDGNAPTVLDEVSVTVNGQAAYVSFISPTQLNVQVPAGVPSGGPVPVVVTHNGQPSAPVMLEIGSFAGGLLAPAAFQVSGKQYAAAIHPGSGAFVSNGDIPGVPAAPAVPGQRIDFYGTGFGPVTPDGTLVAGKIVREATTLSTPVRFTIGQSDAQVVFAGLAQGLVGVYQFSVIVPADAPDGDLPVTVVSGGETAPQKLLLPVRSARQ
ncbi:MAG: IPT/TIG domain-containing protein, partial [Bryobacteraceae bacterium]